MKVNQKTLQYLLILLIAAIGFCAYRFGYTNFTEKAAAVELQNKAYQARIAELNAKIESEEIFDAGIVAADEVTKETLAKYGAGNTPEKTIMMITKLELAGDAEITSISFNDDTPLFVSTDTDENGDPVMEIDSTYIAINYTTSYQGLKDMMDFINNYGERMNVESFTATFNQETAGLSGSMVIDLYSVKDANHEYSAPSVGGVEIGTDNIFGTIDATASGSTSDYSYIETNVTIPEESTDTENTAGDAAEGSETN